MSFVERLAKERAVAILRTPLGKAAAPALEAAIEGGFGIVEVTLGTPDALARVEEIAVRGDVTVGVGTVLSVDEARAAVDAGASFVVSPVLDEDVVAEALRLGVAVMPGTRTPNEMLQAHRMGAPLVKLFPAPDGGPAYVRAILGPLPFLRIVPTSGVDQGNAGEFLRAGAFAVGGVSCLFPHEALATERWDEVRARARGLLAAVATATAPAPLPALIETPRLSLRAARLADAAAVYEGWAADPEVTRYLQWQPHPSVETTREYLVRAEAGWRAGAHRPWLILRRHDEAALGMVSCDVEGHQAELGYVLRRDAWRQGYTTEAARAVLDAVWELPGVRRVWAFCDAENEASVRVLEKLGLAREGRLRRHTVFPAQGPEPRDVLMFALAR